MATLSNDEVARSLYKACSDGNHTDLIRLLDTHPYTMSLLDMTNRRDPPKAVVEKTIFNACLKGHYRVVKELLNCNVNPNSKCDLGTPIYAAVIADSLEVVKLLVDRGAEYRRVVGGFSPVFASCVEGRMKILRYLVNAGADLRCIKNPPLVFTACMQGHLDIFKYLMTETDFDVNWTINQEDSAKVDGKDSLLYVAASSRKLEVADYLLQQGALITQLIISRFSEFIKELLAKRVKHSSHQRNSAGEPLVSARWRELGLAELPWSFLSPFNTRLTKLELRANRLSTLPEEIFQMPNLKILDVSQNILPELSQDVVPWNCLNLTELDVSRNQISYAPSGVFLLPNLTSLNLSYNLLQRLPGDPEDACPDLTWRCDLLKKIDLSHNRLRTLPDTFKTLRRLNTFTVSYNHLHSLPPSMGLGCINLVHLDAAHNNLKELPYGSASYWMHCLERLYLSHNQFEEISRNITELSHLTTLDFSHNHIQYLPLTMSWANCRMSKLSLAYNNLTTLTHALEEEQTYSRSGSHAVNKEKDGDRRSRGSTTLSTMFNVKKKKPAKPPSVSPLPSNAPDTNPRELPFESWSNTLQSLYLQNNNIQFLPNYLGNFTSMARLDMSQNTSVHCLPLTFGRLKNCWELIMHGLDITNVPKHLIPGVGRGASTKQLIAYLKAQMKKAEPYTRMKLMAVGLQGRGKTTLLSVLRDPNNQLPPNVSTVGVSVHKWTVRAPKGRNLSQRQQMDVTFSMWDLAGQEVYYATHQCFLSRNTLYLVVWNMTEGEQGIDYLRPWLLNVQARAPYSPIIVVGTHLDKIPPNQVAELRHMYRSRILKNYDAQGYPTISDICMVSCVTKEGIRDLQDRIHAAALNAKDPDTHEHVIGMQVPRSYCVLQNIVEEEARRLKDVGQPPVLNQKEFSTLAEKTEDISDPEELTLAAQFLHDNGVMLHYNDHLKGLNNLYFIDPVWLADMLAHIITVPQKHSFVQNGILVEARLKIIFHGHRDYPEQYLQQYMQLLERFEIALSLGQGTLLVPSMLPEQRPALPFAIPLPSRVRSPPNNEPRSVSRSNLALGSTPSSSDMEGGQEEDNVSITRVIDGKVVVTAKSNCVRRRYKMAYIPSGFWSRLISRLIINLKRSGLIDSRSSGLGDPNMIYWRHGILIIYPSGRFLVEAIQTPLQDVSSNDPMLSSVKFLGAGIDKTAQPIEGVDITVWANNEDFSAIGYVVDQMDSLIDEWFPGLNDLDLDGEWLVERQALWVTPPELKESVSAEPGTDSDCFYDPLNQEVYIFKLEDCALKALQQDTVYCVDYDVHVPLSTLVPDLLMTDLPPNLIIDQSCFEFNPKDLSTRLGRGGAGAVYKGRYRNVPVAVKEFLTQSQADAFQDEDELPPGGIHTYHDDDSISSGEALFLYRDMRQEVTVLAQLSHPNIVSILGVSLRPMCIALELAPMGSLFGILDKKLEVIKTAQADLPTSNIRMPGGVLGHQISARIALQVALATRYLHKIGIVYRDLKSDNVLMWSLDVNEPVNAKLADYGISRFANPGGIKGEEGTPGYMAPEAIKRRGEDQAFDEKVDIFSFGMLLFELITGQRPFESMSTGQEVNRAVIQRERPQVCEGNMEPCFPGMIELMEDCWRHLAADRPTADEVVQRISAPGFLCRRHTVSRVQQHPLQKIDTIYCQPVINESVCETTQYLLWTWSRQDTERNFSLFSVAKGMFTLPEKPSAGGRVFAMATTGEVEKRLWVATSVARNFPDFEIQVFSYKNAVEPPVYLWSFIVRDSVLDMTTEVEGGRVKRVFASLANGTICVFSRVSISSPQPSEVGDAQVIPEACVLKCEDDKYRTEAEDWGQPLILTLSEAAKGMSIKYMTFVGKDLLWCGCGNSISVINVVEMKLVTSIPVFTRRAQLINELVSDGNKVWGIGRQLANVIEWDAKTYTINCVFDCSRVDPTGNVLIGVPSIEEFILPDSMISAIPKDPEQQSPSGSPQDQLESSTSSFTSGSPHNDSGFEVSNEPENPSKMPYATYNARFSRRTLRGIKPRERTHNMSKQEGRGIFAPRPEFDALQKAKMRSILRQQGATRVTSLLLVHDTLWIARGMGDVLVVDISGGKNHGMAIARLATEDSSKYGNRSNHKLCLVGNEYVVSSQWLEPLDMPRPRAQTDVGIFGDQMDAVAHQQLTVWGAWSNQIICAQAQQVSDMIELDYQASADDLS